MNTPQLPTCPKCGLPLPVDAPKGLCPRCLAAMNLADETAFTGADAVAAQTPLTPAELAPHFPQLEILECLGRGGMGVVYKARQKSLNRFVALKLLAPERAKDPDFADRFVKEAQALAALNHPHIVGVYDFGQAGGFYFLLMEFVDGVNLRQAMKAGRFTPEQALAVVPPVCEALQFAHEHGIVHRDIKPENLLLDKDGRVKIADFGIAKMLGAAAYQPPKDATPAPGTAADKPPLPENATLHSAAGTPQYMAPEQKAHRRTDHRADIYSLGVVLYELLTGELPADKLQPPSRKVQIDVRLDEIVLRALETKPELRYQTAGEMRTQVETVVATPDVTGGRFTAAGFGTPPASPAADVADTKPAPQPRWQGWDVWVIGLCLATFGALWLERLQRSLHDGASPLAPNEASNVMLSTGVATVILLAGAAFLWMLAKNIKTPGSRVASGKRILGRTIVPAVALALLLRTFLLQSFQVATNAATPEIPRGSHVLTWKLARSFAPGDLVVYRHENRPNVGRVTGSESGAVLVGRNGVADFRVPRQNILGKIITVLWRGSAPSGVTQFDIAPVGVSNNVVIVDVTTEVRRGNAELRAVLDGPQLPAGTEAALQDAFSPAFAGTFVKPTPHAGNHPWRILSTGGQTWRLGFVLPDATLARDAIETLRPVGPLPAQPDRTFAGTLFEVRHTNGQVFRASLQVALPFISADLDWVSVYGHSQHDTSAVTLSWEVLAAGNGLAQFSRAGSPILVVQPNPETKLHGVTAQLELTQVGTNRIQLVRRIGGETIREELPGDFRELADELLRTAAFSAKATSGTLFELCRIQGKPFTVQVHVTDSPRTYRLKVGAAVGLGVLVLVALVGGVFFLVRRKQRGASSVGKAGSTVKVVLLLASVPVLVLAVGLALYMAVQARRAADAERQAMAAARAEAEVRQGLSRASNVATPRHAPEIPAIVRGRLLDQDGRPLGRKLLTFVKANSALLTDGPTSDDGTFQFELPVDQPWQVVMLQDGQLSGPRSELMTTPALASATRDEPNYDLELRLEGARLQARLTPLSSPRVLSVGAGAGGPPTITYDAPTQISVGASWFAILLAILIFFGVAGGGVLLLVLLVRKRSSTAAKVLAVLGIVALLLFLLVAGLIFVYEKVRREVGSQAAAVERQAALAELQKLQLQTEDRANQMPPPPQITAPAAGIGVALSRQNGRFIVGSLIPNTPAARDGRLKAGDQVLAIEERGRDAVYLDGMSLVEVVKLLRGAEGSAVTLHVQPVGQILGEPVRIQLVRERLALLEAEAKGQLLPNSPTPKAAAAP